MPQNVTPPISIPNAPVSTIPSGAGARYQVQPPMQGADLALANRVRAALLARDSAIANRVQVSALNGMVYLNGNLPTSADRDLVAGVARGSAGNLNIENELTVGQQ
jgi:osmotically-inducible protein OsmY